MIRRSFFRQVVRFCTKKDDIQEKQSSFLTEAQKKFESVPVHLRPYDKAKYEVPSKKIKKNSGYALIQIQPFPRARIMKICYNLLAEIKKDIAQDDLFRIYHEQKYKYIMEIVDKQEDIQQLERIFAIPSIELLIMNLARHFEIIECYRNYRTWDMSQEQRAMEEKVMNEEVGYKQAPKYPAYRRPERTRAKFF